MNKEQILQHLRWSLQSLALSPDIQVRLFPDFVCVPDELALDFDHWYLCAISNNYIPTDIASELCNFNTILEEINNPYLWTLDALEHSAEWQAIRVKARYLLGLLGWELEMPPKERMRYIQCDQDSPQ